MILLSKEIHNARLTHKIKYAFEKYAINNI